MSLKMKRRDFLKVMGWTGAGVAVAACDRPSFVTHREGRNNVVSYLTPEEYAVPGIGVWYASTCQQCPSSCGIHARVREGRVLKLEGNPDSPLNRGKLCAMGQAGLQTHYNPDRITRPRVRRGDSFTEISWDEALALLEERVGSASGLDGDRFAFLTDTVSGHQAVLIDALMESIGSENHYIYEAVSNPVWRSVCRDMLGEENPRIGIEKARMILSFGADFLGTWGAPVPNSTRYAEFRTSPRGVLVAAEPKMTVTGANADLWVPVRPGAEGVLALGIAHVLNETHARDISALPNDVQAQIRKYDAATAAAITGTSEEHIRRIAGLLHERAPSLVLAGASAEGHENGYDNVAAIMTLNVILGNVGRTIQSGEGFPFEQLRPRTGGTRGMLDFIAAAKEGRIEVAFIKGANPLFTAPESLGVGDALAKIPFKVAFSQFEDETTQRADLILPLYSALEDWGTHVPATMTEPMFISVQQPVMAPLYPETRGFGDLMLSLLRMRGDQDYAGYEDYYAYLQHAFVALPAALKGDAPSDEAFWRGVLAKGMLEVGTATPARLSPRPVAFRVAEPASGNGRSSVLLPTASSTFWDGRHANVPWLQELPDPISKAVWDSWAEMHPKTAGALGIKTGDVIRISTDQGSFETRAYVYRGMHPDAIAVPIGQGHTAHGRYAAGRGVNPLAITADARERRTGEFARNTTRVSVSLVRKTTKPSGLDRLVVMGGSESQMGRKLVATVTADQYERTEGRRS